VLCNSVSNIAILAGRWWLQPVILDTLEAEIRKIMVQSQHGQIVGKTLSEKYSAQKRASRVAQVVERLPREKAVSSNPISTKKHF
jgi:hypothetical protein